MELPSHQSGNPPHDCALTFPWTEGRRSSDGPGPRVLHAQDLVRARDRSHALNVISMPIHKLEHATRTIDVLFLQQTQSIGRIKIGQFFI